jgi:hypothetical protein
MNANGSLSKPQLTQNCSDQEADGEERDREEEKEEEEGEGEKEDSGAENSSLQ